MKLIKLQYQIMSVGCVCSLPTLSLSPQLVGQILVCILVSHPWFWSGGREGAIVLFVSLVSDYGGFRVQGNFSLADGFQDLMEVLLTHSHFVLINIFHTLKFFHTNFYHYIFYCKCKLNNVLDLNIHLDTDS